MTFRDVSAVVFAGLTLLMMGVRFNALIHVRSHLAQPAGLHDQPRVDSLNQAQP